MVFKSYGRSSSHWWFAVSIYRQSKSWGTAGRRWGIYGQEAGRWV